jgi:hypothetical protein
VVVCDPQAGVINPGSPCGLRTGRPPPDGLLAGVGKNTVGAVDGSVLVLCGS